MVFNKWVLLVLNVLVVVLGYLATVDWSSYLPSGAGTAIILIAALKAVLAGLLPAPGTSVRATGNFLFTHKSA
jgi:hypothetical protein